MVFWKGKLAGRTFVVQTSFRYDSSSQLFMLHYRVQQIFAPGRRLRQCPLCEKRGSLKHILSSGRRALGDGRYHRRLNRVLREIAGVFNKCHRTSIYKHVSRRINFIEAGGKVRSAPSVGAICWFGWVPEIPWSYCSNTTSARLDYCFEYDEASDQVGVDGIVGGKHGRVPLEEAR